jgi:hypothetical protein
MFSGDYVSNEIIYDPPHYGTYSFKIPLMDSLQNAIQFYWLAQNLFDADIYYWEPIADTSFIPDGSAQVYEFHL